MKPGRIGCSSPPRPSPPRRPRPIDPLLYGAVVETLVLASMATPDRAKLGAAPAVLACPAS